MGHRRDISGAAAAAVTAAGGHGSRIRPAQEVNFAPTASHARQVTHDAEHGTRYLRLSITFSQTPVRGFSPPQKQHILTKKKKPAHIQCAWPHVVQKSPEVQRASPHRVQVDFNTRRCEPASDRHCRISLTINWRYCGYRYC